MSDAALANLHQAVARYQRIVADGGWPQISGKVSLRPRDKNVEIATIRQHLALEGDPDPAAASGGKFDDAFADALARFQIRNGLRVSASSISARCVRSTCRRKSA